MWSDAAREAAAQARKNGAGPAKPIPNSPYHAKSNEELRFIAKDASEAGRNATEMGDERGMNKYADQVNDAASVLGYRQRGGLSDHPTDVAARTAVAGTTKSDAVPTHTAMATGDGRQYWGSYRKGNALKSVGPHGSREEAASAAMSMLGKNSKVKGVSTGYGTFGPSFDIRFHNK